MSKKYNVTVRALRDCAPKLELGVKKNGVPVFKQHVPVNVDWKNRNRTVLPPWEMMVNGDKWRYENIGVAEGLIIEGGTYDSPYFRTGKAFTQYKREKCFDIPATKELWVKFSAMKGNTWRAYNDVSGTGCCGIRCKTSVTSLFFFANDKEVKSVYPVIDDINTVLLHMKSDSVEGIVEAWVDGKLIYSYVGDVNHGNDFEDFYLQAEESSNNNSAEFSGVIISNQEIGLDETVDPARIPSFRYENVGLKELTYQNGVSIVADNTVSRAGYAFRANTIDRQFPIPYVYELWMKFDFCFEDKGGYFQAFVYDDSYNGLEINGNYERALAKTNTMKDYYRDYSGLHTAIIHIKSDKTEGVLEYWIDGEQRYSGSSLNVNNGKIIQKIFIDCGSNTKTWISNVIISDRELTFDDNCKPIQNPFIKPAIETLGTIGVDNFAVESNHDSILKVLNGSGTTDSFNKDKYVILYFKKPVTLKALHMYTAVYRAILQYSDDGESWTNCGKTFSDNDTMTIKSDEGNPHSYYKLTVERSATPYSWAYLKAFNVEAVYDN